MRGWFVQSTAEHLMENYDAMTIKLNSEVLQAIDVLLPIGASQGLRYPARQVLNDGHDPAILAANAMAKF